MESLKGEGIAGVKESPGKCKIKRMKYDALIFDIDGTLWNASSANAKGWNLGLEELGMPERVTPRQIESVSGYPYEKCIDILLPGERVNHPELFSVFARREAEVVAMDGGVFYDGALSGVVRLALDYRVFLVSNCEEWYLNLFLRFSQLGAVVSGTDCHGMSGLPKDEMLRKMTRDYSLSRPVYIGDTAADEEAAAGAAMAFIHAAWGFGKPLGAPKSVSSFADLVSWLVTNDVRDQ
jgi:phosphoglycolate phosphatase